MSAVGELMKYRVVLLAVPSHGSLQDLAEMIALALQEAGLAVSRALLPARSYALENGTQDILLGAHAAPEVWDRVPPRSTLGSLDGFHGTPAPIAYQTENLLRLRTLDLPSWWRRQAMRAVTWDYSSMNAMLLGARHVPLGYVRSYVRPFTLAPFPDIDVLFTGSLNERRAAILERMNALGLRTHSVSGTFGKPLEQLVARSKLVLHAHLHDSGVFDSASVLPLLHRGACVLGERSCNGEGRDLCSTVPYQDLPETALSLVQGDRYLVQRAQDHVRLRQQRPLSSTLLEALAATADSGATTAAQRSFEPASAPSM